MSEFKGIIDWNKSSKNSSRIINLDSINSTSTLLEMISKNISLIETTLIEQTSLHFINSPIRTSSEFFEISKLIGPSSFVLRDNNSQRSKITNGIFNASEYDENLKINLHTEYSYSSKWPSILIFFCKTPSAIGGETQLGDSRKILREIDRNVLDEFKSKGIKYHRHHHSGEGVGLSWQEAFGFNSKDQIEKYCSSQGIHFEWTMEGNLYVEYLAPATRYHPVTGDEVWFNQVDQYFPELYGEEIYNTLLAFADNEKKKLPMTACFGDGTEIDISYIEEILDVYCRLEYFHKWGKGDFIIVDNMLSHHGRLPFEGKREVLFYGIN